VGKKNEKKENETKTKKQQKNKKKVLDISMTYALRETKSIKGFDNVTIDKLNSHHNANYKSISIGRLIESCSTSQYQYATHNCSTLRGSSGALMLDATGRFAGIHIGIINSRKGKYSDMFFNKETYNKFIPVDSKLFRKFIHQEILPNFNNDEIAKKWRFFSS